MSFTYIDLFAGIGGFHLALDALGGHAAFASEIDPAAQAVYASNFSSTMGGDIAGDIVALTEPRVDTIIPVHDVLAAGFPCQPFSKSGYQRGIGETRGTLFYNIARVIEARKPRVVILENVRNLIGPNHRHTWALIRRTLRDLGYRTPEQPAVFSPHLMPQELLGTPQVRERVFIVAVHVGRDAAWEYTEDVPLTLNRPVAGWHPSRWNLEEAILQPEGEIMNPEAYRLTPLEQDLIDTWDEFVAKVGREGGPRLPGHPIWADYFTATPRHEDGWADWKIDFARKNSALYRDNKAAIQEWRKRNPLLKTVPESRRKLEWQAQDMGTIRDGLIQFRPSGIRVKKPTYVPALVAMNQTSVFGPRSRRLTVREGARLQGFPDHFTFAGQSDAKSFKQLGNAVSVGVVTQVLSQAALLWDFFPQDLAAVIRQARTRLALPDEPLSFDQGGVGLW